MSRIPYRKAREQINDGDLLLFRRKPWLFSRIIAAAGRSPYSHAAMAAWWHGRVICLETSQTTGGRAVLLSNLVNRAPGRIDVYRPVRVPAAWNRGQAVREMLAVTGRRYGWCALIWLAVSRLPVVRLFLSPQTDDTANGSLPFCSAAVARAYRAAGADPVPNLADNRTEPGDLARSTMFDYQFTLGWGAKSDAN